MKAIATCRWRDLQFVYFLYLHTKRKRFFSKISILSKNAHDNLVLFFLKILMYEKLKQYGVNNVINGSEKNEFNSEIKVTRKNTPPPLQAIGCS